MLNQLTDLSAISLAEAECSDSYKNLPLNGGERDVYRLEALQTIEEHEAESLMKRVWSSLPHVIGASYELEMLWDPHAEHLSTTLSVIGLNGALSGIITNLKGSHIFERNVGIEGGETLSHRFNATLITRLTRQGIVLDPSADPDGHRAHLAKFAPAFNDASHVSAILAEQSIPVCIRIVATPTQLTHDEEDALLSSLPDQEASSLTRLIRRAEGANKNANNLLNMLPPFHVGVFVGASGTVPHAVVAALAATISPPSGASVVNTAAPAIETFSASDQNVSGFIDGSMGPVPDGSSRLLSLFGQQELSTVFRLPTAVSARYPGIVVRRSRPVAMGKIQGLDVGVLIGSAARGASRVEVRLHQRDLARHAVLSGMTGTGKSRLAERMAVEIAESQGICYVDPHGDSIERILDALPSSRMQDVVLLNPAIESGRLAINPLEADALIGQGFVIQDLINMFSTLFDPKQMGFVGPRFESWLQEGARTLLDAQNNGGPPATLIDLPRLFSDVEFLKERYQFVRDPNVRRFWENEMAQTNSHTKSELLGWFTSKFSRFSGNNTIRQMLESGRNDIDFSSIMNGDGILLVSLAKGLIGEINSQLVGYIVVSRIWAAALARVSEPKESRRRFTLFIDEFQEFVPSSGALSAMLSQARKFALSVVLMHQFREQLDPQLLAAIDGNVGNRITFRSSAADSRGLASLLEGSFKAQDLMFLPNLQAAAALLDHGEVQLPFTLYT